VSFGGTRHSGPITDETWRFKDGVWTQLHPRHAPPSRTIPVLIFDAALGELVMYGGRDVPPSATAGYGGEVGGISFAADTWTWDGSDWTERHPLHHPVLFVPDAAYDFARSDIVLTSWGTGAMETWTYDGSDWTRHALANGKPDPPRSQFPMAFDPTSETVLLFGGFNLGGADTTRVWEWDGQDWRQTPAHSPFKPLSAVCAPDLENHSILIYDEELQPSTWRWDGTAFQQLKPPHQPQLQAVLAPDPPRHQLLVFGWTWPTWQFQVWAWSGNDWSVASI
jgi:hypothetical protein